MNKFKENVKKVKSIIEKYAKEEGYTKKEIKQILLGVEEALQDNDFSVIGVDILYIMYDALGCYENKNSFQEALYNAVSGLWFISVGKAKETII